MGGLRKVCKLLISRLARILANDNRINRAAYWSIAFTLGCGIFILVSLPLVNAYRVVV